MNTEAELLTLTEPAVLVIIDPSNPRAGELSEIIGAVFITKDDLVRHLCYRIRFFSDKGDGFVDVSEAHNYVILSRKGILEAMDLVKKMEHKNGYFAVISKDELLSVFKPTVA